MENRTYLVTEAEKLTGEKAHVLRYWEDGARHGNPTAIRWDTAAILRRTFRFFWESGN